MTEIKGVIVKGVGGLYKVRPMREFRGEDDRERHEIITCRARGRFRGENITPLPGDEVTVIRSGTNDFKPCKDELDVRGAADSSGGEWVIDRISDRRSELIRPPMANLTHLFILLPASKPRPDLLTADKLVAIAESAGIEPVIVIGKSDLDESLADGAAEIYRSVGYDSFVLSAVSGEGLDELKKYLAKITVEGNEKDEPVLAAFAGVSGAGKSTLMTALFPSLKLASGKVSRKTERGRHTTRSVELFPLAPNGKDVMFLADTPGFSMLDLAKFDFFPPSELAENFREFSDCIGNCRYTKCTHTKEEGCAVIEKMRNGKINPSRHGSYVKIYNEIKSVPEWKRKKNRSPRRSHK